MSEEKDIVDLKPCPFCGGAAREPSIGGNGGDERSGYNYSVTVSCSNCGAQKTIYSKQGAGGWCNENTPDAKQRAIANWNARAEAAKSRMRVENPVQVRDLDWSAAMGDVVASGGLPRDDDDDYDPPCTCCNGTGVNFQTERICTCTRAPSPKAP
jgi:Lar family restriction alleviation protein